MRSSRNLRPLSGEAKSPTSQRPLITDFVLQERLGSGSYANVYKAFWKTTNETVAIKKIQKARLNQASIENILLEIEILKSLKHDFIVEMKDFTWDSDNIYLILEYCSGGDLSNFIRTRRRLPEAICRRFVQQIGKAMQFLRSKHVAHMDLKPKNILLSSSREPFLKLADFGFAQYLKATDGANDMRGSPLYMAPEMFSGKGYDARVDLWSIGVICYECLFGRAPYSSRTLEELLAKIAEGYPISFPSDIKISDKCRDLLDRLLKHDPNERISFEEFFKHPFLDFEHFPSDSNYEKALSLCKIAGDFDKKQCYEDAVKNYLAGLDYLVPVLTYETDEAKKRTIKEKVQAYMARTEEIKKTIRAEGRLPLLSSPGHDIEFIDENAMDYLKRVFETEPAIIAALESGSTAEYMENQGHYKLAMEYYEVAIERLMRFTRGMPASEKRTKLQRQIADWLENAENLNEKMKMFERDDQLAKTINPLGKTIAIPSKKPLPASQFRNKEQQLQPPGESSSRRRTNPNTNTKQPPFRSIWRY
ncbi:serine/threonine-protein kinase ULK3-like isoform X2 [Paramacrobiotus metropolitanus]|uniref:serine/threonine-protein kinase ULK3-like isoform X2 n=1 Tax=Paramacrobiotus metropolitanus TaxID=2943436 RepID=UPI002445F091|nr:serine/threonine-protein kinase ULK3-like isoform X2 [Paramacrobiotus metropolitanus]